MFDTNILLLFVRESEIIQRIKKIFNPFGAPNRAVISVVNVGEIRAISLRNKWGNRKIERLEDLLSRFVIADINDEEIINRYAEIDAFSQGRLESKKSNFTARNMGKNDIWIAATASVLDATLLTTDNDFNHLHDEFLSVAKIDLSI